LESRAERLQSQYMVRTRLFRVDLDSGRCYYHHNYESALKVYT
jgi:hypothetical protein